MQIKFLLLQLQEFYYFRFEIIISKVFSLTQINKKIDILAVIRNQLKKCC